MRQVLLTKAQLDAWSTFGAEWEPFRLAWLERGFRLPPEGDPRDDPRTSLRSRLWEIANARPADLGEWVREARCRTAHEVIGHVFARWRGFREELGPDDWDTFDAAKMATRHEQQVAARKTWTRLGDVLAGVRLGPPAGADEAPRGELVEARR